MRHDRIHEALPLLMAIAVLGVGCGKKDEGGNGSEANANLVEGKLDSMPTELLGEWQPKSPIFAPMTISATGIRHSHPYEKNEEITFKSLSCRGTTCDWLAEQGKGTITYDATSKRVTLKTSGLMYESKKGPKPSGANDYLSQTFTRRTTAIPAAFQGTWYSCDNPTCGRVKLVIAESSVTNSGTGGKCIEGSTPARHIVEDGPKLSIASSPQGEFTFLSSAKGFELLDSQNIGERSLKGNYSKDECTPREIAGEPAKDDAAKGDDKPSSGSAKACEDYVQCVCDLSDEIDRKGKGTVTKTADCSDIKKAYGALGAMGGADTCKQMLDAYKQSLGSMSALYATQGIKIPSSCK